MKKTLILTLAALMTFSMSSLYASAADMTETSALTQKQKPSKKKKGEVKEVTFLAIFFRWYLYRLKPQDISPNSRTTPSMPLLRSRL